ncbi:MAG: AlwI family type II restriction endonuclease [Bacteroidales bacterium]|nr:AlwI family type II restriction endonuclease [Bacteroidales bacterium]
MARINSRILFLTTSPRTPQKMVPEIRLLADHFSGQKWTKPVQAQFMEMLRDEDYFFGKGEKDPAFSARDRINRAPKALGFIQLMPKIVLTEAGKRLLESTNTDEIFLRQLLKFQLPSPFHQPAEKAAQFNVRPYLELLRLIRHLGTLKFDELQIFGLQLTDWRLFNEIVAKISRFRQERIANNSQSYRTFKAKYLEKEILGVYGDTIKAGNIKTRESQGISLKKFVATKAQNMRDYADAAFRYLRATGLVEVSYIGKSLSIVPSRIPDVDFLLQSIDRNPCFIDDEQSYLAYLSNPAIPALYSDDRDNIINRFRQEFPEFVPPVDLDTESLKSLFNSMVKARRDQSISTQVTRIKNYSLYEDIQHTFSQILNKDLYDPSLMLEWNAWRAMTMLNGGKITANLHFDDYGNPMSTAQGNVADVICDYSTFSVAVEVTTAEGQKQYEMEGEPVSRHLGKLKKSSGKPAYALLLAPTINAACVAHFYQLHHLSISFYGGKSIIVPMPINIFQKMVEDSYRVDFTPNPSHIQHFFEKSMEIAQRSENEIQWYNELMAVAANWLRL